MLHFHKYITCILPYKILTSTSVLRYVTRPFHPLSMPRAATTNKGAAAIIHIKWSTSQIRVEHRLLQHTLWLQQEYKGKVFSLQMVTAWFNIKTRYIIPVSLYSDHAEHTLHVVIVINLEYHPDY